MIRLQQHRSKTAGVITNELQGEGIISYLKGLKAKFDKKLLEDRPKVIDDLLIKEGDQIITKIEVCRNPISGKFSEGLNVLTLGRLKSVMQKMGYDKLFHLYMILTLANGKVYSLEKNQRINVYEGKKLKSNGDCAPSLEYGKETLREFIMDTEAKNIKNLYRYNAFKDNCQKWVYDNLNSNGITQFNDFVLQDVSQLAPSFLERIARGVTDVAGYVDYAIRGGEYEI